MSHLTWLRNKINISQSFIKKMAFVYISLPLIVFFVGYLKWYIAIICLAAVGYAVFSICREKTALSSDSTITITSGKLVLLFALMLLWTQLGGMNGFWYQSDDWFARNAIFRDLITHPWPVKYTSANSGLVYYFGHWLVPALFGKLAQAISGSERITWFCARMALWIWSSAGLTILALLLFHFCSASCSKRRTIVLLTFALFSGLDIIGTFLNQKQELLFNVLHLEWWQDGYQYSSITTCLYWVFNQAIIPWIATMVFLLEKNEKYYVNLIVPCLLCGPFPAVGLGLLMVGKEIEKIIGNIKHHEWKTWIKEVFSPENILSLVGVLVLCAFILTNNAVEGTSNSGGSSGSGLVRIHLDLTYILFFMLEVGIYILLLWNTNKKNVLFYAVLVSLIIIPWFHVGMSNDFCQRVSIPGVFILMVYAAREECELFASREKKVHSRNSQVSRICAILLAVTLAIGALTPLVEVYRGIFHVVTEKTFFLPNDWLYSFEYDPHSYNFTASNIDETFFFKYLAR